MKKTALVALGILAMATPQAITASADTGAERVVEDTTVEVNDLLLTDEVGADVGDIELPIFEGEVTEADIMPISADDIMPISAEVDDDMLLYEGDLEENLEDNYTDKSLGENLTEADIHPISADVEETVNKGLLLGVFGALGAAVIGFFAFKGKGKGTQG